MTLDPRLLEILVCPACAGAVREARDGTVLRCEGCSREFPVRDGIPSMIVDDAAGPENPGSEG